MHERAKAYAESYTEFVQNTELAKISAAAATQGICLTLCFYWLGLHMTNAEETPTVRLNKLRALVPEARRKHVAYQALQRQVRRMAAYTGNMALVSGILGEQGMQGEADALFGLAQERGAALRNNVVTLDGVDVSGILVQSARARNLNVTGAVAAGMDPRVGARWIDLAAHVKARTYWILNLSREHAICGYTYTHWFWADYTIVFDPNFGEFKVSLKDMNAAFFFLYLMADTPEYAAYRNYELLTMSR